MKFKKIKRTHYLLLTLFLVFFCVFFLFKTYTLKTSKKIDKITKTYFHKEIYNSLNSISKDISSDKVFDVLNIEKNKDGEILYVDYDLSKTYQILDDVTNLLKKNINAKDGIVLKLPFLVSSNNIFISNMGPKITVKINYTDALLTNIYTKITNYGMNNALVEAYIKISIEGQIITPITKNAEKIDYDMLISSKIINGRVPLYYGGYISTSSSIFDIPIKS